MSDAPSRFQLLEPLAERSGVRTYKGLDPLTGLPVLIYRFSARPTVDAGLLESDNLPGILASRFDAEEGEVVIAYSPSYQPLDPTDRPLELPQIIDAARALRDAAEAGVVHGDLRPDRLLVADGAILIEGFGIPWEVARDEFSAPELGTAGSYAGDVYALAMSFLKLDQAVGNTLPLEIRGLLERCLARDPAARPAAGELLDDLLELAAAPAEGEATTPWNAPLIEGADDTAADDPRAPDESPFGDAELIMRNDDEPSAPPRAPDANDLEQELFRLDDPVQPELIGDDPDPDVTLVEATQREDIGFDFTTAFLDGDEVVEAVNHDSDPGVEPVKVFEPEPLRRTRPPEPEPLTIDSNPDPDMLTHRPERSSSPKLLTRKRTSADDEAEGFIKDLPPGAKYRTGNVSDNPPSAAISMEGTIDLEPRRRIGRRALLFLVLIVAIALLGFLVFWLQDRNATTLTPARTETYPVDVTIQPANLPPVTLLVVQSPDGSELPVGANLGKVTRTRRIALDRAGVWSLQAVFQDRNSPVVTLTVPQQNSVTFDIPAPAAPGP